MATAIHTNDSRFKMSGTLVLLAFFLLAALAAPEARGAGICEEIDELLVAVDEAKEALDAIMEIGAEDAERLTEALQDPDLQAVFAELPELRNQLRDDRRETNESRRGARRARKAFADLGVALEQLRLSHSCP